MLFNDQKAIYLQIIDHVMEKILVKEWIAEQKIPSVRELGASIEVNPNTVMRAYDKLQQEGLIFNKRGLGFYVSTDVPTKIQQELRKNFMKNDAPKFFQHAKLLNISLNEIVSLYNEN